MRCGTILLCAASLLFIPSLKADIVTIAESGNGGTLRDISGTISYLKGSSTGNVGEGGPGNNTQGSMLLFFELPAQPSSGFVSADTSLQISVASHDVANAGQNADLWAIGYVPAVDIGSIGSNIGNGGVTDVDDFFLSAANTENRNGWNLTAANTTKIWDDMADNTSSGALTAPGSANTALTTFINALFNTHGATEGDYLVLRVNYDTNMTDYDNWEFFCNTDNHEPLLMLTAADDAGFLSVTESGYGGRLMERTETTFFYNQLSGCAVGEGGSGNGDEQIMMMLFELPQRPSGGFLAEHTSIRVTGYGEDVDNAGETADMWAVGYVPASDIGNVGANLNDGGVTDIDDFFLSEADTETKNGWNLVAANTVKVWDDLADYRTDGTILSPASANAALTTFINALFDSHGAVAGDYVVLRLNYDANMTDYENWNFYTGNASSGQPVLTLTKDASVAFSSAQVLFEGTEIADGATNALTVTTVDVAITRTYVVTNLSTATTNLFLTNSPAVVFSESGTTSYNGFTIVTNITGAATNLAPGDAEAFTIHFVTNAMGLYTGTVSIANSDANNNPYTFLLTAEVSPPAPSMQVSYNGSLIADGKTNALPATLSGVSVSRTYTVANLASATGNLLLTNSPSAVFSESGTTSYNGFTIISNITGAATNLAVGESEPFTIQFSTNAVGSYSATVSIGNTDTNNTPYTFKVKGEVTSIVSSPATYTSDGVFVVPSGVTEVTIKAWGAGGGGGGGGKSGNGGGGGGGAFAQGTYSVTPGDALNIIVGGGGGAGLVAPSQGPTGHGGGGGGLSSVSNSTASVLFVVAAGGGGGGGGDNGALHGGAGAAGGSASVFNNGADGDGGTDGGGGGTLAGGGSGGADASAGTAGSAFAGGAGGSHQGAGSSNNGGTGGGGSGGGGSAVPVGILVVAAVVQVALVVAAAVAQTL
jgi:hypothetical protein